MICFLALSVLVCSALSAAVPSSTSRTTTPEPIIFDILPDASELTTRLGGDCDGATAQAESRSSSFSMVLPGGIVVSAAFSEARSSASAGGVGPAPVHPFRGRGVLVTAPNGQTYNVRAPVEADFKVEGPEGTKSVVQRILTSPLNTGITFPST